MEKQEWKPFPNALDKSERKKFDEMWEIPRLYISACSNSVPPVPLHPILITIAFHHYRELMECSKQVEEMMMQRVKVQEARLQNRVEQDYSPPPPPRQQSKLYDFFC